MSSTVYVSKLSLESVLRCLNTGVYRRQRVDGVLKVSVCADLRLGLRLRSKKSLSLDLKLLQCLCVPCRKGVGVTRSVWQSNGSGKFVVCCVKCVADSTERPS